MEAWTQKFRNRSINREKTKTILKTNRIFGKICNGLLQPSTEITETFLKCSLILELKWEMLSAAQSPPTPQTSSFIPKPGYTHGTNYTQATCLFVYLHFCLSQCLFLSVQVSIYMSFFSKSFHKIISWGHCFKLIFALFWSFWTKSIFLYSEFH